MRTTDELEKDLKSYNSLDRYLEENQEELVDKTLSALLQELLDTKSKSRAEVIKASNLNEVYAYQIISGVRRPSRDKLLSLCIAMGATLEETQTLLKQGGFAPLYAKMQRDSIIMFSMEHGKSLIDLNQLLYERGEETL